MDLAPALPPSQDAVPAFVSTAAFSASAPPHRELNIRELNTRELNTRELNTGLTLDESTVQLSFLPVAASQASASQASASQAATSQVASSQLISAQSGSLQSVGLSSGVTPPALLLSISGLGRASARPVSFLSSARLSRSFHFLGQTWQATRFGNALSRLTDYRQTHRPALSATVPIQWASLDAASGDRWQSGVTAADIQVRRVNVTAQVAQLENEEWSAALTDRCMPDAERQLQDGLHYKISLGEHTLGYVADEHRAYLLAQQLKRLVRQASFDPDAIAAYPPSDALSVPGADMYIGTPDQPLFAIDATMADDIGYSTEWAAVAWANNLRLALDAEPLTAGDAAMGVGGLAPSNLEITGEASWYGPYFHGRATANGETYDQNELTVAHKSLPFGTQLRVRNVVNGRTVVVRVNDRGPYVGDRILDLSKAAADCLGSDEAGVIPVEATVLTEAN